jgi:hypothetical protein
LHLPALSTLPALFGGDVFKPVMVVHAGAVHVALRHRDPPEAGRPAMVKESLREQEAFVRTFGGGISHLHVAVLSDYYKVLPPLLHGMTDDDVSDPLTLCAKACVFRRRCKDDTGVS